MDQLLKERRMASASARRRRISEREQEDRKYQDNALSAGRNPKTQEDPKDESDGSDHGDENGSDSNTFCTAMEPGYDSATSESPSDISPLTPDDIPTPPTSNKRPPRLMLPLNDTGKVREVIAIIGQDEGMPPSRIEVPRPPPSPALVLESSLTTLSDWTYQRYSTVLEPSKVTKALKGEECHEPYSPIEIATPVSYQLPKARPAMISVVNVPPKSNRHNTVPQNPPTPPERSAARPRTSHLSSYMSAPSAFLAAEATEVDFSTIKDKASEVRPQSPAASSQMPGITKQPVLVRKTSAPLLFLSSRFSHSESSSLAMGLKSEALSSTPAHGSRPASTIADLQPPEIKPRSRLRQISNPRAPPSASCQLSNNSNSTTTAKTSQRITSISSTTLLADPTATIQQPNPFSFTPTPAAIAGTAKPQSALHIARKKSISALSQTLKHAKGSISRLSLSQARPTDVVPAVPSLPILTVHTATTSRMPPRIYADISKTNLDNQLPPTPTITDTKAIWMSASTTPQSTFNVSTAPRSQPRTRNGQGSGGSRKSTKQSVDLKDFPTPPLAGSPFLGGSVGGSRPGSSHLR